MVCYACGFVHANELRCWSRNVITFSKKLLPKYDIVTFVTNFLSPGSKIRGSMARNDPASKLRLCLISLTSYCYLTLLPLSSSPPLCSPSSSFYYCTNTIYQCRFTKTYTDLQFTQNDLTRVSRFTQVKFVTQQ